MKFAYDLHIHSALSPCASDDMTPNNIVNMALLKGLDIIAVTDHNSIGNLPSIIKCASKTNLLVIPGMELETSEEVHLICLFPGLESAISFSNILSPYIPQLENREEVFGRQLIIDENDNVTGKENRLLLGAASISIDVAVKMSASFGGVAIPAHIDRSSYSILSNLGSIPDYLQFNYLELSEKCDANLFLANHPELVQYNYLVSSDAHYLGDILECGSLIELEEKSIECFLRELRIK